MSAIEMERPLPAELAPWTEKIDETMKELLDRMILHAPERDDPMVGRLYQRIYRYLHNGGKRMHGLSVLLAYRAAGGRPMEAILPVAAGLQLYHHHTLVHDDLYDDDQKRRGEPTVHEAFRRWFMGQGNIHDRQKKTDLRSDSIFSGTAERKGAIAGVVYGKILHAFAFGAVLSAPFSMEQLYPVIQAINWHDVFDNVGQMRDVFHEGDPITDPEACLWSIWLKTGKLFETNAICGAQLGGARPGQLTALKEWVVSSAMAYQLQDDLEDIESDSEKGIGRGVGTDLMSRKPTYLLALALRNADGAAKKVLDRWINYADSHSSRLTLGDVIQAVQSTGAVVQCRQKVAQLVEQACQALDQADPPLDPECFPLMTAFSRYFVSSAYWKRPLPRAREERMV